MWTFLSEDLSVGLSQHYEAVMHLTEPQPPPRLSHDQHHGNRNMEKNQSSHGNDNINNNPTDVPTEMEISTRLSRFKIKTSDYLNLCFRIKWFYNTFVKPVLQLQKPIAPAPDYPKWVVFFSAWHHCMHANNARTSSKLGVSWISSRSKSGTPRLIQVIHVK